jgi:hypothetical protein
VTKECRVAGSSGVERLVELAFHRRFEGCDLLTGASGRRELPGMDDDGVPILPGLDFCLLPVALRISFVVAVPAVGGGLDDDRASAVADPGHDLGGNGGGGRDIVAVDRPVVDAVSGGPLLDAPGVLGGYRRELGVPVVLAPEEGGELPHGCEVQRLVECALGHGAIPEERHDHAAVASQLGCRRRPDGDGEPGGHDPVGAEDADAGVGDVHRSTPTPVGAPVLAHQLREHPERVEALGQAVPVPAVVRGDHVVGPERPARAHGGGLLPGGQMHEPRHLTVAVERRDPLFEASDPQHSTVHLQSVISGERERRVGVHHVYCTVSTDAVPMGEG